MYTVKKRQKAINYLKSNAPEGKDFNQFVSGIIDLIPNSSKAQYGDDPTIAAANYHFYVMTGRAKKLEYQDVLDGGGLFQITKDCIIGDKGTIFTYMPIDCEDAEDTNYKGLMLRLGNTEPLVIDGEDLFEFVITGQVKIKHDTGKKFKKSKNESLSKQQEKDFKIAAKGLRELLSKYDIKSADDVAFEVEMLYNIIPEEYLELYPDSKEGKIIAAFNYSKDNVDEVEDLLKSRKFMKYTDTTQSGMALTTGVPIIANENKHGFVSKYAYITYYSKDDERFYFVPAIWLDPQLKVHKMIFATLAVTTLAMTLTLPPVGAALLAVTPATSIAAPAVLATVGAATKIGTVATATAATAVGAQAVNKVTLSIKHLKGLKVKDSEDLDILVIKGPVESVTGENVTQKPRVVSVSREALEQLIKEDVFSTDEKLSKKLRYA